MCDLDGYVVDMHWFPPGSAPAPAPVNDVFALAFSDGAFAIVHRSGRVERRVADAHRGAVTSVRWNPDGTALVTAGEDGAVRTWSRAGELRSAVEQRDAATYCASWRGDGSALAFGCGRDLFVKPLDAGRKTIKWRAHDGVVLACDWSATNGLIASGGEDGRFKVWDETGRLVSVSSKGERLQIRSPIASVAWAPNGEHLVAGGFDAVFLADARGFCAERTPAPGAGTIGRVAWTRDGTTAAGAGASGAVAFASVVASRRDGDGGALRATLATPTRIDVSDAARGEVGDEGAIALELSERVVVFALGHGYLLAATKTKCLGYARGHFATGPKVTIDASRFGVITHVAQCASSFAVFAVNEGENGGPCQLFAWPSGRKTTSARSPGLRARDACERTVSLAPDALAHVDAADPRTVRFLETRNAGAPVGHEVVHAKEVRAVALNQRGSLPDRRVAFADVDGELFVSKVAERGGTRKLCDACDSHRWSETHSVLACVSSDGKLRVWSYPDAAYVDRDLVGLTTRVVDGAGFGRGATLTHFDGRRAVARRATDGATLVADADLPHVPALHEHADEAQWDRAIRLCRLVKEDAMWAVLALRATAAKDLATAEMAYAALGAAEKVRFFAATRRLPSEAARSAELALFRRDRDEAEQILLNAGMTFRAIDANVSAHRWRRALELATKHKTHADTVVYYRNKYLERAGREETDPMFREVAQGLEVDEEAVLLKVERERKNEHRKKTTGA